MKFQTVYGVLISEVALLSCVTQKNESKFHVSVSQLQPIFNQRDSIGDAIIEKYFPGLLHLIKDWELRLLPAPNYMCPQNQPHYVFGLFSENINFHICPTQEMKQTSMLLKKYFNIDQECKYFYFNPKAFNQFKKSHRDV
jgi:hypothetical protein